MRQSPQHGKMPAMQNTPEQKAPKRGRPTDYKEAYAEGARKLALLGATDAEIADFYGVDVRTIYRWKNIHEAFCQSLKAGKDQADDRVERALYHRAIGYEQEAVKIFMPAGADEPVYAKYVEKVAPDTTAAIFWLKNRRRAEWRDRVELDNTSSDGSMSSAPVVSALDKVMARLNAVAERHRTDSDTSEG